MRKPEEIRKEIEALNKELEAVKIHESRQVAAVNILYNLGWTHDPHKGWQKPALRSNSSVSTIHSLHMSAPAD